MVSATTFEGVVEAIMAGHGLSEVTRLLRVLPSHDRQAVLCTVCAMHSEIATNSTHHAADISALLTSHCRFYIHGVATCLLEREPLPAN